MQRFEERLTSLAIGGWMAGGVLAVLVALADGPLPGEVALTEALQAIPGLEPVSRAVRAMTTTEAVLLAGAAFAAVLFFARMRQAALVFAIGLVLLPLAQGGIKEIVDRPRPEPAQVDVRDDWTSPSFPSGHVMSGTFLYVFLAMSPAIRRRLQAPVRDVVRIGAFVIVAVNAVANVYMGVHWPTDVLAGLLFGGGLALWVVAAEYELPRWRARTRGASR